MHTIGDASDQNIEQRMAYRKEVANAERRRPSLLSFDGGDRNLLVGKALLKQQAEKICLENRSRGYGSAIASRCSEDAHAVHCNSADESRSAGSPAQCRARTAPADRCFDLGWWRNGNQNVG